jgi:hypothetical protein
MLIKNGWGGERIAQLTGRKEDEWRGRKKKRS